VLASGPPFWLPGVPTTTARSGLAAATHFTGDHRGKVVVIGGYLDKVLDTYEIFDPETSRWTIGQVPATPLWGVPVVSGPDGKIYFVLGDQHETWVYDGTWNRSLAAPPPSCAHAGLALGTDRLLYVLCTTDLPFQSNPLMTYDTELDRWTILQPTPTATVNGPWMTSLGSRIYFSSTSDGNRYPLDAYDIVSRTWSTLASSPVPSLIVGAPDGRVYVIAGFDTRGPVYAPTAEVNAYSPQTNRWTPVVPLKFNRYDHAVTVGPDGRLYAIGGVYDGAANTDSVEIYGPAVSITPSTAAPGDAITLTGNNFAAGAKVRVYVGPDAGTPLEIGTTDGAGALSSSIVFRVPSLPPGNHVVTVVDDKSRYPVTIPLSVR
jgi:hypothetical protein